MCAVVSAQLSSTFCLASINIINPTFRFCRYPFVALLPLARLLAAGRTPALWGDWPASNVRAVALARPAARIQNPELENTIGDKADIG
jgi:hypothetical protein